MSEFSLARTCLLVLYQSVLFFIYNLVKTSRDYIYDKVEQKGVLRRGVSGDWVELEELEEKEQRQQRDGGERGFLVVGLR